MSYTFINRCLSKMPDEDCRIIDGYVHARRYLYVIESCIIAIRDGFDSFKIDGQLYYISDTINYYQNEGFLAKLRGMIGAQNLEAIEGLTEYKFFERRVAVLRATYLAKFPSVTGGIPLASGLNAPTIPNPFGESVPPTHPYITEVDHGFVEIDPNTPYIDNSGESGVWVDPSHFDPGLPELG